MYNLQALVKVYGLNRYVYKASPESLHYNSFCERQIVRLTNAIVFALNALRGSSLNIFSARIPVTQSASAPNAYISRKLFMTR